MKNIHLICCMFIFVAIHGNVSAFQDDPLLKEVIAGHKALRQSIRSFSAQVVTENEIPTKKLLGEGKYWRLKDSARIQQRIGDKGFLDYLVRPNDIRIVSRFDWVQGEPTRVEASRLPGNDLTSWCDVWGHMVLDMKGPHGEIESYETLVAQAKKLDPCRRITWNNRPCIQVVFHELNKANEELTTTFIHDIGYNYLVVETIGKTSYDRTVKYQKTMSDIGEFAPGIFFPSKTISQAEKNGKITSKSTTTLNQITINSPLKEESLALPEIPDGTPLEDRVAGIKGTIDSNWNWIEQTGKTKPLEVVPSRNPTNFEGPTVSEPTSSWNWGILAGGGLLLLTGSIWIYWKFRPQ